MDNLSSFEEERRLERELQEGTKAIIASDLQMYIKEAIEENVKCREKAEVTPDPIPAHGASAGPARQRRSRPELGAPQVLLRSCGGSPWSLEARSARAQSPA